MNLDKPLPPTFLMTSSDTSEHHLSETGLDSRVAGGDKHFRTPASTSEGTASEKDPPIRYPKGPRLVFIFTALYICLFLTNLEIPIVTTSLVGITNDLQNFKQGSWVIASYLLGYVGVLIIVAKLSDIFGRKTLLLISLSAFIVFSAVCGAAQSIEQLIVFRALQGVGGAGNYAVSSVMMFELVPPAKYSSMTSIASLVYCLSLLLGPIFGGAITATSTWRWVFFLNIPAGVIAGIILILCVPSGFPNHGSLRQREEGAVSAVSRATFNRVDFLGAGILLAATTFFVAAMEEAGGSYSWSSALVITFLVISGTLWIVFMFWERLITTRGRLIEPVFPWRFALSRVWNGMLLNALFLGAPWFVTIFQLPQRLQFVELASPLSAGLRLMPFTAAAPVGSMLSAFIAGRWKVPPIYFVVLASCLQIVGFALMSTLPASAEPVSAQYGFEVLAGFGCGINISLLMLMTPFSVDPRDKAVALGSIAQFRVIGGAIGVAIATTIINSQTRSSLAGLLSPASLNALLQSAEVIKTFDSETQNIVRQSFAQAYDFQMKVLAAFAAAQIPASALMWQKKQITV